MKKQKLSAYYCRLCWQEFNHPNQHNSALFLGTDQLSNPSCPGDIQARVAPSPQAAGLPETAPEPELLWEGTR